MRRSPHGLVVRLATLASLAMVLVLAAGCSGASGVTNDAGTLTEIDSTPGRQGEGIAVHGHWTIEVRNPDESLVERFEFDNALVSYPGPLILVRLLARENSAGGWQIALTQLPADQSPFLSNTGVPTSGTWGYIVESSFPLAYPSHGPHCFTNLTVAPGDETGELVLSGTATAHVDGIIRSVQTTLFMLPATQPPSDSYGAPHVQNDFTRTTLPSPINLTAGQSAAVTVVISFT